MGLQQDLLDIASRSETGISFAEFMRLALYHPDEGYYAAPKPIGRQGDFFTSVSVGPCFAFLLTQQLLQIRQALFSPSSRPMDVVEQGAHDAQLSLDLLAQSGGTNPWRHRIVEPNPRFRAVQSARLGASATVVGSLAEAAPIEGVFLCNELLDAFPVQRLRFHENRWREIRVIASETSLLEAEFDFPFVPTERWPWLPTQTTPGFETEVCEGIEPWLDELTDAMPKGVVLIIDYGSSASETFLPERADGSVRGYQDHRRVANPLEHPGLVDLTADVNFTHLWIAARARGWQLVGFADQAQFLTGIAAGLPDPEQFPAELRRQFQTLTHPGFMGRRFRVLGLSRGVPTPAALDGFRFSGINAQALERASDCPP